MTVFIKCLWFLWIALFPCWFAIIGSIVLLFEEKYLGRNFDE